MYVFGPGARGVAIQGNLIGADIDGADALPNGVGVLIRDASGVRVGGGSEEERNIISGNNGDGVRIELGSNNVVAGNYIGTTADGMSALRNDGAGVHIVDSSGAVIGGVEDGERNVISGNDLVYYQSPGVWISGSQATGNRVVGNYIGLAADGATPVGNGVGVIVQGTPQGNVIGGTTAAERNVISGNGWYNIHLAGTQGTTVQGNYIGSDWTGTQITPVRARNDIRVDEDQNSLIGGTEFAAGNVIVGAEQGVYLVSRYQPTAGTRIQGNRIGTTADGQEARANIWGIYVDGYVDSNGVTREVLDVLIGGAEQGAGNVISGSQNEGIVVNGPGAQGITIQGNRIGTDIDGVDGLGNGAAGILLQDAYGVQIGGMDEQARNVISGNSFAGVEIVGGGDHVIQNNYIGTNADGDLALGNSRSGIRLDGSASHNMIGGATVGLGNLISGNGQYGIETTGVSAVVQHDRREPHRNR